MAEGQDESEKTEEPTQKKIDDAREKGQVASSREVNHWVMFLAAAVIVLGLAPVVARDVSSAITGYFVHAHAVEVTPENLGILLGALAGKIGLAMAPVAVLLMVAALFAGFVQNGILFSTESIKPTLDKISPLAGLKRMFSLKSLAEFAKGILKLIIVGAIAFAVVSPDLSSVETVTGLAAADLLARIRDLSATLILAVLSVMTAIAAADFLYQKFEHTKKLRMSRQDMKDEYKQTEGDPIVKQRLRQIRADRSRKRMIAEVPNADVVVTNPTHYSVALKYDQSNMGAPQVVAKGVDTAAKRIREVANENNVPIVENPPLARALYASVDVDDEIPEEHFRAVAEVINYVWKLKGRK